MKNGYSVNLSQEKFEISNGNLNITQEDIEFELRLMGCVEKSEELLKALNFPQGSYAAYGSLDQRFNRALERSFHNLKGPEILPPVENSYEIFKTDDSVIGNRNEDYLVYEGEVVDGIKDGQGILKDAKGIIIYDGKWENGKYSGIGCLRNLMAEEYTLGIDYMDFNKTNNHWEFYKGNFRNGVFEGFGVLVFTNGETYEGNFIEGKTNGSGLFVSQSRGLEVSGIWANNKLISANL